MYCPYHPPPMDELLTIMFAMPTLPWTVLVIAAAVYWVSVIAGLLDIEVLGGADGHAHGGDAVGHGHAHGGDAGHAHGDAAHADSAEPAKAVGEGAVAKDGVVQHLLGALALRSVPATISLSLFSLWGWVGSFALARYLLPALPGPVWLGIVLGLLVSALVGLFLASLSVRPLAPMFRVPSGPRRHELVGKTVRITTGRVDERFGEGLLEDGGAGLRLQVRCADAKALARDDEALILAWSESAEAYEVEPMSRVEGRGAKRPAR